MYLQVFGNALLVHKLKHSYELFYYERKTFFSVLSELLLPRAIEIAKYFLYVDKINFFAVYAVPIFSVGGMPQRQRASGAAGKGRVRLRQGIHWCVETHWEIKGG